MNSKIDRLNNSIENMEAAIKYYLKEIDSKYFSNKIKKSEYLKLVKDLKNIKSILDSFKSTPLFENEKITEIRRINLSNKCLYDEGDYSLIFSEIMKTNNDLCQVDKDKDRKRLGIFKQIFNGLSNYYQYRLRKSTIMPSGELGYSDKGLDNFSFIVEKYLTIKYNFKKIKYEDARISATNQQLIDEYANIIESDEIDNSIKELYSNVRNFVKKYAESEIIISNLEKIKQLCNEKEFLNINAQVDRIIEKYKIIFNINKEKYYIVMSQIYKKSKEYNKEILKK